MSKTVLITGGSGFLGCHLARRLLQTGFKVTLFDLAQLDAKNLPRKVTFIQADIRDKKAIDTAIKGNSYVVHAAAALPIARSKQAIFSTNIQGTINVLQASLQAEIKRLVFISSTAVYGVPKKLPETETSPLDPIGYYGQSKLAAENVCKQYMKKGLSINILRPKTFVGPERLGVFQLWFEAIYTGKRVFLLGNGNNPYQLLAVSDLVDAILKSLTSKKENQIFNIGAKEFQTWRKDLQFVIDYAKSHPKDDQSLAGKSKITGLPKRPSQLLLALLEALQLSPIAAWHYKTLPVASYVSTKKAEKMLGWKPKKSNQELLLENYKWYEKHRNDLIQKTGTTHRVAWNFKILSLAKLLP